MGKPEFAEAVAKLQADLLMDGIFKLRKAFNTAIENIVELQREPYEKSKYIIDVCLKLYGIESKNRLQQRSCETWSEPPDLPEIDDTVKDEPSEPKHPPYSEY